MSRTIDQRVVEMQFDNRDFERNVSTSMSTLEKLKRSLNLSGAAKGLTDVGNAAKSVDMSGLGGAVDTVRARFSALQVMGVTALANITNSAVNAGKRIVSALTIDPVKSGFQEYETQINAVQTILANTKSKGSTLDDVNKALDTLNTYADKTIYNFTEMTRNIGTFTAAGIDLETSVSAIQGIANLAAVSGSTSQQASTAMYQLSQALASGTVKLMDWNSVVNAGMGGEIFQNALKKTSELLGTGAEAAIKAEGSFRESLSTGWLTSEVLTETLKKFTTSGANEYVAEYTGLSTEAVEAALKEAEARYGEADAIEYASKALAEKSGKNKDEIKSALEMARTAEDAATKVKTFSQLWDTLKEAAQSGWTQTWEIIIGDFEEAKDLLTQISDTVGAMIGKSAEARNALLQDWKDQGGRNDLIEGFKNAFEGLMSIVKPIREAFAEVFPPVTVNNLLKFTEGFKNLTEKLIISEETAGKLKRAFKGVFSIFDIGRKIILTVADAIAKLLGSDGVASLGTFLLDTAASIGDFFTSINEGFDANGLVGVFSSIGSVISDALGIATDGIRNFGDIISGAFDGVIFIAKKIWDVVKPAFEWIIDNVSAGDIFAGLAGGGIFVAAKKLSGFLDKIIETIKEIFSKGKGGSIKEKVSDVLDSVHDSLISFSSGIKVSSLVSIAIAIGILSVALGKISELDTGDIVKSLFTIGAMLGMLSLTMRSITKSMSTYGSKGLIKSGVSLIFVAKALDILANAMETIAKLSLAEIGKGLIGIGVGLGELCVGLKIIDKTKISLRTSIAIIALAKSCQMLGDALQKFAKMSWGEIGRGLTAMGGALLELVGAISILNKFGGGKSIFGSLGILIVVQSLEKMSDGLEKFAKMSWAEIKRGLSAMGGALGELVIALGGLGKISGFSSILASGAILITVQSLSKLADALKTFGGMTWDGIKRGLVGMGGALTEVAGITGVLGKLSGFSGILGSSVILITVKSLSKLADAFKKFGRMTWDAIIRGLVGMGGALTEVATISGVLGKLSGFSGILGAGLILIAVQSLGDLADSFKKFGGMTWDEIKRGLVGMGGALTEVATISGLLGSLTGFAGLIGSGSLLLGVQSLGDLADALQKFGEMSWDEVKRGLTAMGGALSETAIGGLLNTFSILGSFSISTISSSLGTLADSVKKWTGVTVPEGLGLKLGELARGIEQFTFGGFGAIALSAAAPAIGTMADSVRKWEGVTVPDGIEAGMTQIANGVKAFSWAFMGGWSLDMISTSLGDLSDSIRKWEGVTVPDGIESGMTQIANGVKAFSWAFMGGWSLNAIINSLGELSDTIKKWNDVTIPDSLETGLTQIANGVKSFSLAFLGGWSLNAVVKPLGDLSDSVRKWTGVTIPEDLGSKMSTLADAVGKFTFSGFGASALATAAPAVGTMADSVKKWSSIKIPEGLEDSLTKIANGIKEFNYEFTGSGLESIVKPLGDLPSAINKWNGVTIPEGLETNLTSLANGIKAFNWAFLGGWSLETIVKPLADLPDSIRKWDGVTLPEGLETNLTSLANGIRAFNWALMGGLSLGVIAEPLGDLAVSAKEWNGVILPEGLEGGLKSLANGVKTFSWAFAGGLSLGTVAGPLGDLADSVKKWNGVTVPEGLESNLDSLASGIKSFSWAFMGGWSLDTIAGPLGTLADSIKKWDGVSIPEGLGDKLKSIASGVKSFAGVSNISYAATGLRIIASSVKELSGINFQAVSSDLSSLSESIKNFASIGPISLSLTMFGNSLINGVINPIRNASGQFVTLGASIIDFFINGMRSRSTVITSHMMNMMSQTTRVLHGYSGMFIAAGGVIMTALASGISAKGLYVTTALRTSVLQGAASIYTCYASFYSAGSYLVDGFANGISMNSFKAQVAAAAMAKAALEAAKEALGIASPSKEGFKLGDFYGLGFVNAIVGYRDKVYKASSNMAESAKSGLSEAIGKIQSALNGDMDFQPTIRPVVDLSNVKSGAGLINEMFGKNPSIGKFSDLSSVSAMMDRRIQNGANQDVISAIDKLRKGLSDLNRPSYNINGITYDDGSNVADAIQTLIRAAKIERRV